VRNALAVALVASVAAMTGCGGSGGSQGFGSGERHAAQLGLNALQQTSVPQKIIEVTQTADVLPDVCRVNAVGGKQKTFRLLVTWVPPYAKQLDRSYAWLEADFSDQGVLPPTLHLGTILGSVPKQQALRELRAHYGGAFARPSGDCQVLTNGFIQLLDSHAPGRGAPASGYVVGPNGKRVAKSAHAHSTAPLSPLVPAPVNLVDPDPDQSLKGDAAGMTVVRHIGGDRYELLVQNTSDIGFINTFEWSPPAGLRITGVSSSSTGRCALVNGGIGCAATLRPPRCTCNGSGGAVTIRFTAQELPGARAGVAHLTIRAMSPVPYIIPSHLGENLGDLPVCKSGQSSSGGSCTKG